MRLVRALVVVSVHIHSDVMHRTSEENPIGRSGGHAFIRDADG